MPLTELSIKALKPADNNAEIHYDDVVPGFGVRVTKSGVKSYILTHGRRRIRETIGRVGIIDLKLARAEAKRLLATYTLGKAKPLSTSWKLALAEYLAEVKAKRRKSTYNEYQRLLKKYFKYGDTKLEDLSPNDLQKSLDRITTTEHFHAYVVLRAFIKWCHRKHYVDTNPIERMATPKGSAPRERVLTDQELKAVWSNAGDDTFGKIVKLLLLTGQRRSEIASLADGMIKDDLITFPSWLTKNCREHAFPIAPLAIPIIPDQTTGTIFCARGTKKPFNGWSKSKAALDKRCGVKDWTLHDLRRTLRTRWAELGISSEIAETYINHISGTRGGIARVYNLAKFLQPMRDAVKVWEAHLQTVLEL